MTVNIGAVVSEQTSVEPDHQRCSFINIGCLLAHLYQMHRESECTSLVVLDIGSSKMLKFLNSKMLKFLHLKFFM